MAPSTMQAVLPQLLSALPHEWRGTTFKNSQLLGREGFARNMSQMVQEKQRRGSVIREADLIAVGNAEDYLRVSSNISTTLEMVLAEERGLKVEEVLTFASRSMPIIAVALSQPKTPVHVYNKGAAVFSAEQLETLQMLGCNLHFHEGAAQAHEDGPVLAMVGAENDTADGIVGDSVLYITNRNKINPADMLTIRKRTSTPLTTPVAEQALKIAAGQDGGVVEGPTVDGLAKFHGALQTLSGTAVNPAANPVVFTAGLPAISSMYLSFVALGGADIVMCSTAYGGSNQLTQIFDERADKLRRHTFDIQGDIDVTQAIKNKLESMASHTDLLPRTVLFVEIPTNPDMKIPEIKVILDALKAHKAATGKEVMLAVDTTFAPGSGVMKRVSDVDPDFPSMVFISMSKSVSRGLTTAGTIVANHTEQSIKVLDGVRKMGAIMDTTAKDDQLKILCENHTGVVERCQSAYNNAAAIGTGLVDAVKELTGKTMGLQFVQPCHADIGYTTSTFSFNLPAPEGASMERKEALAQDFVTAITVHPEFKPCVSFGQDNNLVYATVPATSTQGAISQEDKSKQAADGVQLVRLSFPPVCKPDVVLGHIVAALKNIY